MELLDHEDLLQLIAHPDAAGHSLMDVVMAHGNQSMIDIFAFNLERINRPRDAVCQAPDATDTMSPPQASSEPEAQPQDLPLVHHIMAALSGKTVAAKAIIPVLYAFVCSSLDWAQGPLGRLSLLMAGIGLHVVLPNVFYRHFLPQLERARELAAGRGLRLSDSLEILDPLVNERYQRFALQRTSMGLIGDLCTAVMLALAVTSRYLQTLGLVVCVVPQLSAVVALILLRGLMVSTGRRKMKQVMDICLELCILLGDSSPQLYAWATGNSQLCALPAPAQQQQLQHKDSLLAGYMVAVLAFRLFVTKALLSDRPLISGAVLAELVGNAIAHCLLVPTAMCLGWTAESPVAVLSWGLVVSSMFTVFHVAHLISKECQHLCAFLAQPEKARKGEDLYSVADCCAMLVNTPLSTH